MVEKQHPLAEPRVVAAVGLIALGSGLGVGLMLARTLIIVGFLLSLACAAAVFWLYFAYLAAAYRALTGREKYNGPRVLELLIAMGMSVVLTAVACAVFPIVLIEAPSVNRARLQLSGFSRLTYPGTSQPAVNVQINNAGNINAIRTSLLIAGRLEKTLLEKQKIEEEIKAISTAISSFEKRGMYNFGQITTTRGVIITLQDIREDGWTFSADGKFKNGQTLQFSDEQWGAFEKGLLFLYVLYVARYEDEGTSGAYWEESFCGYFTVVTTYWHNCAPNEIRKISGTRK